MEGGWRTFLLKIQNDAGSTSELRIFSPNAQSVHNSEWKSPFRSLFPQANGGKADEPVNQLWLDLEGFESQPLNKELSGVKLEYRIVSLYSRDAGQREAKLMFDIGQGTQDLQFRVNMISYSTVRRRGKLYSRCWTRMAMLPTGMFLIRDGQGRIYPSQAKRLAPDFAFHPQIYRSNREKLRLPEGQYAVEFGRGPEYLVEKRPFEIAGTKQTLEFKLKRWIDPSKSGWWSGESSYSRGRVRALYGADRGCIGLGHVSSLPG